MRAASWTRIWQQSPTLSANPAPGLTKGLLQFVDGALAIADSNLGDRPSFFHVVIVLTPAVPDAGLESYGLTVEDCTGS